MMTVNEVSRLTGVSVRTLHYYDTIGLLPPTSVTEAGYRLYDDTALSRLQSILLFRELQFPLREIKAILDLPGFDSRAAIEQQIIMLEQKRRRLDEIIASARRMTKEGVNFMDFNVFNKDELEQYAAEAKQKWGSTQAYKEYEQRSEAQSDTEQKDASEGLMKLFAEAGKIKTLSPDSSEAQELIERLHGYISANYYTCTNVILAGLRMMYVGDERMMKNIDNAGGEGTAQFVSEAISVFCAK